MTPHRIWKELVQDDSGQDLIEYALIAGLIGVVAVASLQGIATAITTLLTKIQTALTTAST